MQAVSKFLILLFLSIAAAPGADKDDGFRPEPIETYTAQQTISGVTIAARIYQSDEETRPVFGKRNPYKYGVMPVLVIMKNGTDKVLNLEGLEVRYVAGRDSIEATPADEVKYVTGADRPKMVEGPIPRMPRTSAKKGPLTGWQIEGRAFAARMLPPGDTASGFFYFQAGYRPSASLYIQGIEEAVSGQELFYFEIPLRDAR
jgi:hypothetical protein